MQNANIRYVIRMSKNIEDFAVDAHEKTNHKYDGKPYYIHLEQVVSNAFQYIHLVNKSDREDVINACWMHDTIEDCRLTYNDVKVIAGKEVANIVYAVTNEKGKNRKERANEKYYQGIRNNTWATFVKLCDRLANVKYSKDNKNSMFDLYKKENEHFLLSLQPSDKYKEMVSELCTLLETTF